MNTTDWIEQAKSLIRRAALAPSSHNTQPWVFRISAAAIQLYADRTRASYLSMTQTTESSRSVVVVPC